MHEALASEWGRLFHNWEKLTPDDNGWPDVGQRRRADREHGHAAHSSKSFGILGTCIREAPEFVEPQAAAPRRR